MSKMALQSLLCLRFQVGALDREALLGLTLGLGLRLALVVVLALNALTT